ncbi:hypothetical protein [Rhodoferax sp. GW822-FHT02A01]|uniref:hypothetical protein n=1 Tax=Rhodoferax sp. GW822-FHT02A01 TaxID=3141537 RepID=UPI00315CA175
MKTLNLARWLAVALALLATSLCAQQRDPTQPPPGFSDAPVADKGKADLPVVDGAAIVTRNGKPFLVSGTRLYAAGQSIGPYKIERITETEIWLRQGKELRKIQRFNGIERHTATERPTP